MKQLYCLLIRISKGVIGLNISVILTAFSKGIPSSLLLLSENYYQWAVRYSTPDIDKISIKSIVNCDNVISMTLSCNTQGTVRHFEAMVLCYLVKELQPRTVIEIGTCDGVTSRNIALNASNASIYTFDLPNEYIFNSKLSDKELVINRKVGSAFIGTPQETNINQYFGDSATFDFTNLNTKFDFAFIDGSHTYDYVKNDTEKLLPLMHEDAWIVWHDCCQMGRDYGVYNYLKQFSCVKIIESTTLAYAKVKDLNELI